MGCRFSGCRHLLPNAPLGRDKRLPACYGCASLMKTPKDPPENTPIRRTTPLLIECDKPPLGCRCTAGAIHEGPCRLVVRLCEISNPSQPIPRLAVKCELPWGHNEMQHRAKGIAYYSPATEPMHHTRQRQVWEAKRTTNPGTPAALLVEAPAPAVPLPGLPVQARERHHLPVPELARGDRPTPGEVPRLRDLGARAPQPYTELERQRSRLALDLAEERLKLKALRASNVRLALLLGALVGVCLGFLVAVAFGWLARP